MCSNLDWDDFAAAAALAELIADDEAERIRLETDQQEGPSEPFDDDQ